MGLVKIKNYLAHAIKGKPSPKVVEAARPFVASHISKGIPGPLGSQPYNNSTLIERLNIKNMGYALAQQYAKVFAGIPTKDQPKNIGLVSKPTTQSDVESPWFVHWCQELKCAPLYHRKLWEFAFVLQALFEHGLLKPGAKGMGFGCGDEPLPSYFASKGVSALVTDLAPEKVQSMGWAETGQHAHSLDLAFKKNLTTKDAFKKHVSHQFVDMNAIPKMDTAFDFCWSICALEHLGSIQKGLDFIENSLSVLKPGGLAVHTTEYNYLETEKTIDNWPTVLFLRKHFEDIAKRLQAKGHIVFGPCFDAGNGILDGFIDVPPYPHSMNDQMQALYATDKGSDPKVALPHLKLAVDGFACTCYGLIVQKKN